MHELLIKREVVFRDRDGWILHRYHLLTVYFKEM